MIHFGFRAVNMVKKLNLQELFSSYYYVKETGMQGSNFCGYTLFGR
jgi:hypothetical protein